MVLNHRCLYIFRDTLLLAVTLLSLSLILFKVGGFTVSLAFVFNLYFLVSKPLLRSHLNIFFLFLSFFLFNLFYQIWALDIVEFVKTFALFSFAIFTFLNLKRVSINNWSEKSLHFSVKLCAFITVGVAVLQVFEFLFFNTTNSYKIFDSISISTAESTDRFQAVNLLTFIRPISVYHEPSYYGSVVLLLFMCVNALRMHLVWKFITFVGILLSLSMTVYFFTILYISYLLKDYKYLILMIFGFFILASPEIWTMLRIDEISREGTSGNQRLVAPIYSIMYEFTKVYTVFGRALGQTEKQLDNSFFVLFGYFGVFFPLLLYFIWRYIKITLNNSSAQLVFIIFFLNILFLNGAVITPESQFMLFFLFLVLHNVSFRETLVST
jgi:hypothetical protein